MHNNYYFLKRLSAALAQVLTGTVISACFSQNKDELVIQFETHHDPFFVKASLGAGFSHLSFPKTFQRARKNSVDLFPSIIGYRVTQVRQFNNERSFALILEEGVSLVFLMHGNRSNIALLHENRTKETFRSNVTVAATLSHESLDRHIDWSYEHFLNSQDNLQKVYFTFGKVVWRYFEDAGYQHGDIEQKWQLFQRVLGQLNGGDHFLTRLNGNPHLTLLSFDDSVRIDGTAIEVANHFFQAFSQQYGLTHEKSGLAATLKARIKSSESYLRKNLEKIHEIEQEHNYRIWADLVMANLHQIKMGDESAQLQDFYQPDHLVTIRLKKELSPQANAAVFYRKAKNQHLETQRIRQAIDTKQREVAKLQEQLILLENIGDVKTLRALYPGATSAAGDKQTVALPYYEFHVSGFRIWVGKGAQQNDELTLKYSYKEDLWLHAKDVPGSHVLIKHQSGKPFPKDVIERAAQLAAFNSKRKTETLCPVVVTPKKFVRKRKGDPPGAVVVEREEVILVEPIGVE